MHSYLLFLIHTNMRKSLERANECIVKSQVIAEFKFKPDRRDKAIKAFNKSNPFLTQNFCCPFRKESGDEMIMVLSNETWHNKFDVLSFQLMSLKT